jgi:hypothetical protein
MHYKQNIVEQKYYRDSRCKVCQQFNATMDHILSACPILAEEDCIVRHDCVRSYT